MSSTNLNCTLYSNKEVVIRGDYVLRQKSPANFILTDFYTNFYTIALNFIKLH